MVVQWMSTSGMIRFMGTILRHLRHASTTTCLVTLPNHNRPAVVSAAVYLGLNSQNIACKPRLDEAIGQNGVLL
jgi:hypothetical protein